MSNSRKVVILKSFAKSMGGLEKTAYRIASAFLEQGADVSILTTQKNGVHPFLTDCGTASKIPIHALNSSRLPSFLRIGHFDRQVQQWLKEHPTDLIFGMDRNKYQTHIRAGNGVHAAYLQCRILTEGRIKYEICRLNPLHRKILRIEKEAFEHPDLQKIFTNSHMVEREILDRFSTDPSKIHVIHNGVEWDEMKEDFAQWPEQKIAHCKRLGLDPDHLHLLFIGNGYLRKGLKQLLHALSLLKCKDIHLSVIGKDKNQAFYEKEAARLGFGSQIRFFGSQTDIRPFYQIGDVLAIPSYYDPFANVTVEALAMGLFVISSKSNGGSEVITPQTGTIIDDLQDVESISESLQKALAHRKTAQTALLIRHSVQHLNYQKQMKKLVELSLA